jgi:hypothetical protein
VLAGCGKSEFDKRIHRWRFVRPLTVVEDRVQNGWIPSALGLGTPG